MRLAVTAKVFAIWLAILCLAVANGFLREAVLVPGLGRAPGLVLSGVLLSAGILVVTVLALPWLGIRRRSSLIGVGVAWLVLTLVFEFAFGRAQGQPWPVLLEAYTFKDGNLWPVVLLVTVAAPCLAAWLRSGVPWRAGERGPMS